jgi:predicted Rossmann fold flavoprotein
MHCFDVAIVGAGAAGLWCAALAGQRGLKVLLLDHSEKVAEKIRISGGGRCNFTNREVGPAHFLGENPHFCRSALSRYTPQDFIALVQKHGIAFHEKHKGQLFCDRSAEDIIAMLLAECRAGGVERWQPCKVGAITHADGRYGLQTDRGEVRTPQVVIASGGLSIPKIGASDFGYRIAKQFGLRVVEPRPALVPLLFDGQAWQPFAELAGVSLPVRIATPMAVKGKAREMAFHEDLLFTHKGLSGPAVLQISSYWQEGGSLWVHLAPEKGQARDLEHHLLSLKARSRRLVSNELAQIVPARLAEAWTGRDPRLARPFSDVPDKALAALAEGLAGWELRPTGTEGYRKAEVTAGGVDTRELSSQTMESGQKGLYFIGEVVDVTGWLGGYNFQWAWASAHACAQALAQGQGPR